MLEDYDPYFADFVNDVGYCISLVFQAVEIFLGVGYLIGSKTVSAIKWLLCTGAIVYNEVAAFGSIVAVEVTEFGASFIRAILLIFYGASKIFESFYITAVDLQTLYYHVTESLYRTVTQTAGCLYDCLTGALTEVPQQIVTALSMIGESTLVFKDCMINILVDFVCQLFWSPVKVVMLAGKSVAKLLCLPYNVVRNMPPSSVLGLIVIVITIFVFRRLLRYLILKNLLALVNVLLEVVLRILSFIRVTKLKQFVTYSVSTIAHMRDSTSFSGSCKAVCVICQEKPVSFMSTPCKHVCLCETCVQAILEHDDRCPICRSRVSKYDRVFIP